MSASRRRPGRPRHPSRARPRRPGGPHPPHRPVRRLSQNFLVDPRVAERIVDLSQVGPRDTVIEIGPGTGALTRHLVARAGHVHAVELDGKLFDRLGVEFEAEARLTLHRADILEVRVEDLVPEGRVVVVGNLPYAITSDLVLWLLDQHASIRRAVVLMQREVATRLTAEPGERAAGSLTLAVCYRAETERILDVPPDCFRPVPKVHSSLVAFRFRPEPAVRPRDETFFFRVIRAAFGERRKTLVNALATGLGESRAIMEKAVTAAGLDPRIRGERLSLEDFSHLADLLGEHLGTPASRARGKEAPRSGTDPSEDSSA